MVDQMEPGPAYPYSIGAVVEWTDCLGRARGRTTVVGHPGPWTVATSCGRWIPVGLIDRRVDGEDVTAGPGGDVDAFCKASSGIPGQLSLF